MEDKLDKLGPLLSAIGGEVAADLGGNADGAYLYVEVGDRWISVNLYKDEGDVVRSRDHGPGLTDSIWSAWEAENPDPKKRWCVMEYEVHGTKFDVHFQYPNEVDVETYDGERRRKSLKSHFGDKPIIYPPPPNQ